MFIMHLAEACRLQFYPGFSVLFLCDTVVQLRVHVRLSPYVSYSFNHRLMAPGATWAELGRIE